MEQQVLSLPVAVSNVLGWSTKTNIIGSGFVDGQYIKITEEVGELAGMIARNNVPEIKDAAGDIQFILINLIAMFGYDPVKAFEFSKSRSVDSGLIYPNGTGKVHLLGAIQHQLLKFTSVMKFNDDDDQIIKDALSETDLQHLVFGVYCALKEIGKRYGFTPEEALTDAWNVVKEREGIFYNRVFIKSADFTRPMLEEMLASKTLPAESIEMANRYLVKL